MKEEDRWWVGKGLEWQQGKGTVAPNLGGSHIGFVLGLEQMKILG